MITGLDPLNFPIEIPVNNIDEASNNGIEVPFWHGNFCVCLIVMKDTIPWHEREDTHVINITLLKFFDVRIGCIFGGWEWKAKWERVRSINR